MTKKYFKTFDRLSKVNIDTSIPAEKKINQLMSLLCDYFQTDAAILSKIEDTTYVVRDVVHCEDVYKKDQRLNLNDTFCADTFAQDDVYVITNNHQEEKSDVHYIGLTYKVFNQKYGTLGFFMLNQQHKKKVQYSDHDRFLLDYAVEQIGRITENIQTKLLIRQQQENFNLVLNSSSLIFLHVDNKNGHIDWLNQSENSFRSIFHTPPPSTLKDFFRTYIPNASKRYIRNKFFEHLRGNSEFSEEIRFHCPAEQHLHCLVYFQAKWDNQEKIQKILGTIVNISKQKQNERALQESEERFRIAFENAPFGVALVSPEGKWLDVNIAICDILGYTKEELLGTDFQHITYTDDLADDLANVQKMLANEIDFYEMEKRYIHKNGNIIWCLLRVGLIHRRNGEPKYFISQIADITERKTDEQQHRQNEKMEALGHLAGNLAHELNNFLQPILTGTQLLLKKNKNKELEKYILTILKNTERSSELIQDILAFSRLDNAKLEEKSIHEMLTEAVEFCASLLPKSISLRVSGLEKNTQKICYINPNDFIRLVTNILLNAMYAMECKGDINIVFQETVIDSARAKKLEVLPGQFAKIEFQDEGPGVPENIIDKIFDPFFTTKKNDGTGLGLPIIYGIARSWKGTITIHNVNNKGACFTLYIPIV